MKTLIATTILLVTSSAFSQVQTCTFEDLAPPLNQSTQGGGAFWSSPLADYDGFHFSSDYFAQSGPTQYNGMWGYYDVKAVGWGGYDEAMNGHRAIFTPWNSNQSMFYEISRGQDWVLYSLDITAAWNNMTAIVKGYNDDELVFTYTVMLQTATKVRIDVSTAFPPYQHHIDRINVYGMGNATQLAIDDIRYQDLPAPSALALIGLAGLVGCRNRRR